LAARRRTVLRAVELVEVTDGALAANEDAQPAPGNETKALRELRQAEEELAAVEAAHWTTEFELADAEAAVEAAEDALNELDSRRMEARRDKVTAQRHLSEARSRQRHAVSALAEARRRLESARQAADRDE
jgi:chromosome segregation ATPase